MANGDKTEDPPIFPDQPWWSVLLAVVITLLVTLIATRAVNIPTTGAAPTVGSLMTDTALFLPHALILFGILADMFTYQGVYSIPSLVGVLSIFANKILDYFWLGISALLDKAQKVASASAGTTYKSRGGGVVNYNGCYVQGFEVEGLKSNITSQTLVVTATILCYYIMDLVLNKGWGAALASIVVGGVLFLAQVSSMSGGGCFAGSGIAVTVPASIGNGILFGGIAYAVVQAYFPNRLPSRAIQPIPPSVNDLTLQKDGRLCDDKTGKCYITNKNGDLVEDTCGKKDVPADSKECVADLVDGDTTNV